MSNAYIALNVLDAGVAPLEIGLAGCLHCGLLAFVGLIAIGIADLANNLDPVTLFQAGAVDIDPVAGAGVFGLVRGIQSADHVVSFGEFLGSNVSGAVNVGRRGRRGRLVPAGLAHCYSALGS